MTTSLIKPKHFPEIDKAWFFCCSWSFIALKLSPGDFWTLSKSCNDQKGKVTSYWLFLRFQEKAFSCCCCCFNVDAIIGTLYSSFPDRVTQVETRYVTFPQILMLLGITPLGAINFFVFVICCVAEKRFIKSHSKGLIKFHEGWNSMNLIPKWMKITFNCYFYPTFSLYWKTLCCILCHYLQLVRFSHGVYHLIPIIFLTVEYSTLLT